MNDDEAIPEEPEEAYEEEEGPGPAVECMLDAFSWYQKRAQTQLVIRTDEDGMAREWRTRLMPGPAMWLWSRAPAGDAPFELEWIYRFEENLHLRAWASGCPLDYGGDSDWKTEEVAEAA